VKGKFMSNPESTAENEPIIDSVPGVTQTPAEGMPAPAPAEPGSRENPTIVHNNSEYWGGYTGHRVGPNGTNPNTPVVNDPENLAMLQAAADLRKTPKQ
jgi:hypothetical protein